MTFSLARSVRRVRPQRKSAPLVRRSESDLAFAADAPAAGAELLLDTCVYVDVLQGKTPPEVDRLLRTRIVNHSTVALAELTHSFGRLDPTHKGTRAALKEIGAVIEDIPRHRLAPPSGNAFGEAGMLAGLAARLTGAGGIELLNDALLYLQAREAGFAVLTANVSHFDGFEQLMPGADLLFYQT